MKLLVTIALLEASMIGATFANPNVVYLGEPIVMIAENVDIVVRENDSAVSGIYSFRQVNNGWPRQPDDSVTIQVPIIVPRQLSFASLKASTAVSLTIGKRTFKPAKTSADPRLYDLPSNWRLCYFEFEIPRAPLRPVFTIAIRYIQPQLPGKIAPYYPIHPPERWAAKSVVRYSMAQPGTLALVSRGETILEAQRTRIAVQPQHHKLILVRVNKT